MQVKQIIIGTAVAVAGLVCVAGASNYSGWQGYIKDARDAKSSAEEQLKVADENFPSFRKDIEKRKETANFVLFQTKDFSTWYKITHRAPKYK